jgi:hypothetical protein
MFNHVIYQVSQPLALVIARAFVVHVSKRSLYRIGFRAVGRQIYKLDARIRIHPLLNRLRLVNLVVVYHHKDARVVAGRVSTVNYLEQIDEQSARLAKPDAVQQMACSYVERSSQVILLVSARSQDLKLSVFLHPLITNLRQQVDVEFVSKQQELFRPEMLENPADSGQFLDALWVVIFGCEFGSLPDPAHFSQPAAQGIGRGINAAIDLELGRKGCTTPARTAPAEGFWGSLEQRKQGAFQRRRQNSSAQGLEDYPVISEIKAKRVSAISSDNAIDRRAGAEQESSDLGGSAASGAKQQNVQSEQVTITSGSELRKYLLLLRMWNIQYGRIGHSLYSETNRVVWQQSIYQRVLVCANLISSDLDEELQRATAELLAGELANCGLAVACSTGVVN